MQDKTRAALILKYPKNGAQPIVEFLYLVRRKFAEPSKFNGQYDLNVAQFLHEIGILETIEGQHALFLLEEFRKSYSLSPLVAEIRESYYEQLPQAAGKMTYVYQGNWATQKICVKMVRLSREQSGSELLQVSSLWVPFGLPVSCKFQMHIREVIQWTHLSHHNVLPFYGAYITPTLSSPKICFVAPWIENGTICEYLERFPQTSRLPLVS